MEIVIIVLLLASLFGVWLLSVRRKLETQEENIRNAMYQTLVQLSAEREALEGLAEFLGQTMDAETFRRMKHSLENETFAGECTDCRRGRTAGMGGRTTERIIESTEKNCRDLGKHAAFAGTGDLSEVLESSKKL